ncbi:MAG: proton-conducting transporter membrane subunit [Bacillota bacterium]
MAVVEHLPVLGVAGLLAMAFVIPLLPEGRLPAMLALAGSVWAALAQAGTLFAVLAEGTLVYHVGSWPPPWGIEVRVDLLGAVVAFVVAAVGLFIAVYALGSVPLEIPGPARRWYFCLQTLLSAGMLGLINSGDLFNIFVFLEITSLAAYALVAVEDKLESLEASFKYLVLGSVGSGLVLLGIAMIYMVTGHLNLEALAGAVPAAAEAFPRNLTAGLSVFVVGIAAKSALFPLHVWLPDAHANAPSPASALLSGLVLKTSLLVLVRVTFNVLGPAFAQATPLPMVLFWLSTGGILLGSLFAIAQRDLKRMLAYSSVAQVAYIFFGLSVFTHNAVTGAFLHIVYHAMLKASLFMAAGLIIARTGQRRLGALSGIGRHMPLTTAAFAIAAVGMIGLPPTGGFLSKWYLALGSVDAAKPLYAFVIVFSSLLNAMYFLPLIISAFFGPALQTLAPGREGPLTMVLPTLLLSVVTLLIGIVPHFPLNALAAAAAALLGR